MQKVKKITLSVCLIGNGVETTLGVNDGKLAVDEAVNGEPMIVAQMLCRAVGTGIAVLGDMSALLNVDNDVIAQAIRAATALVPMPLIVEREPNADTKTLN